MITHFLEASDGVAHGKFLLARLTRVEISVRSALPGFEETGIWRVGGARKFNPRTTLMLDLQTGEGAGFYLTNPVDALYDLTHRHPKLWVCPMFRPTLVWLGGRGLGDGRGDITALPRFIEIPIRSSPSPPGGSGAGRG